MRNEKSYTFLSDYVIKLEKYAHTYKSRYNGRNIDDSHGAAYVFAWFPKTTDTKDVLDGKDKCENSFERVDCFTIF